MAWTEADTKRYWAEVNDFDRQLRDGIRWGRCGADPFSPRVKNLPARTVEADDDEVVEVSDEVDERQNLTAKALELMPKTYREVLELHFGGKGSTAIGRALGIRQASASILVHEAQVYFAYCAKLVEEGITYDVVVSSSKRPNLAKAYLQCWTSTMAAQELGAKQTTIYHQIRADLPGSVMIRLQNRWKSGELARVAEALAGRTGSALHRNLARSWQARATRGHWARRASIGDRSAE